MRRALLALLLLVACQHSSSLPPTESDAVPEITLWGAQLQDSFSIVGGWYVSERLLAPTGATRVGTFFEVDGDPPSMEARGFDADGDPGDWQRLNVTWSEGKLHVARADLGFDAYEVELRVARLDGLHSLTWSAVVPLPLAPRGPIAALSHALRPELADIVVDRSSWGARPTRCTTADTNKTRMAIHHTVTPADTDPARVRGIQSFHMDTRGWCDIGYHFLITKDGTVYEGRPLDLLGAHVAGHNTGNVGISFVGCFHTSGCMDWSPSSPPEEMIDAAATMVGRLSDLYGIPIDASRVKGHRDHSGATTTCPGDNLHARLDDIRGRAGSVGTTATYRATFVSQTFPLASEGLPLAPGEEVSGDIAMRNDGTATWRPGETFLGTTEPRDLASPLAASDWISPSRPATVDGVVAPGEVGRFRFSVRGPGTEGDYSQYFNLVQDGTAWFSAPPDDQLQVRVVVSGGMDAGFGREMDGAVAPMDGGAPVIDAGTVTDAAAAREGTVSGGCSCRSSGEDRTPPLGTLALLWLAVGRRGRSNRREV